MKKFTNYLKRYYQCMYKFDLYRDYFREPLTLAMLFILPMVLLFIAVTYSASIETPTFVEKSFDPVFDLLSTATYEEVIDFEPLEEGEESPWSVTADQNINIQFDMGEVLLEQSKPYDQRINNNGDTYRIIIDTNNDFNIALNEKNSYSTEVSDQLGFKNSDMVAYINKDFVILEVDGSVYSYNLAPLKGSYENTEEIYHFLKEKYVDKMVIFQFSIATAVFLVFMYFGVMYFVVRAYVKREQFDLDRKRKFKIIFYSMQPGLYVYCVLSFFTSKSDIALSFITPLLSVFTMMFINTKTMEQVKDYVKKERKAEKRLKRNQ